jgi:hypothetical protein
MTTSHSITLTNGGSHLNARIDSFNLYEAVAAIGEKQKTKTQPTFSHPNYIYAFLRA